MTTVAKIQGRVAESASSTSHVYVGRAMPHLGLMGSKFANPFKIGRDGTRHECIRKYLDYVRKNPSLIDDARTELRGKKLFCWCVNSDNPSTDPLVCHAQILARIADGENVATLPVKPLF